MTSDVVYVRLHGDTELYTSGYGPEALDRWAEKCRAWAQEADVYVYFDNWLLLRPPDAPAASGSRRGAGAACSPSRWRPPSWRWWP